MRARGINHDTGFLPGDDLSRKTFTAEAARRDLAVIAGELHCDAVRISGGDPERLGIATQCAADAGLEVWFAPFPVDLTPEEMLPFFADCAERAEVVFVAGCGGRGGGCVPGRVQHHDVPGRAARALRARQAGGGDRVRHLRLPGRGRAGRAGLGAAGGGGAGRGRAVRYFTELLDLFEEVGVDTALWFTFAAFTSRKGADLCRTAWSGCSTRSAGSRGWGRPRTESGGVFRTMAARYGAG
ncbi:hypothetical protein OG528_21380 [Streptomyces platensis]|uniref:hypothetical protein n=1 Tax=Streptomyces platensis TaxID=58346 RepID=UPI0030E28CF1